MSILVCPSDFLSFAFMDVVILLINTYKVNIFVIRMIILTGGKV